MENLYVITEKRLRQLLATAATYDALEFGNVIDTSSDSYNSCMRECLSDFGVRSIDEVVDVELLPQFDTLDKYLEEQKEGSEFERYIDF